MQRLQGQTCLAHTGVPCQEQHLSTALAGWLQSSQERFEVALASDQRYLVLPVRNHWCRRGQSWLEPGWGRNKAAAHDAGIECSRLGIRGHVEFGGERLNTGLILA